MQLVIHLIIYGRRLTRNETKKCQRGLNLSMHQQIGRLAAVPPRSLAQASGDVLLTQPSVSSIDRVYEQWRNNYLWKA